MNFERNFQSKQVIHEIYHAHNNALAGRFKKEYMDCE